MPASASDDFDQLKLLFTDPLQHDYEVIRPIVLFAETVAARSSQTGLERTTVGDKARRFLQQGMLGLADQREHKAGRKPHQFPEPVAAYILYLKQLYPPIHDREIVRIVQRKFGYTTNHHTVKRFLAEHAIPVQLPLPWTTFHQFEDAYRARWTVVRMYYEGWHMQSIAGCLKLSRQHVWHIIRAFEQDGFAGLEDQRTRPTEHPANQLTLPFLKTVLDIQAEYPRAGRFRVHGLLAQRLEGDVPSEATVGRAMAINRQLHGAPGPWSTDRLEAAADGRVKLTPYTPHHRHQYWFVDLRYLRKFDAHWTYSICVLEGYSRKILAGMASEYQDEVAILQLLVAALTEYGCPMAIVSDNGAVFTADAYCGLLETLGIAACYIEKGQPWENLIEAQFKVQLRLADAKFEQAVAFDELQQQHAAFVELFNTTPHWAHRERPDQLHTPAAVLAWTHGRQVAPDELRSVLRHLQFERSVDRNGYVSIQRFYIYAERGLARQRVSIWLYEGRLQIAYREALLARYAYHYDRRQKQLRSIEQPLLYRTGYASPQLEFWELDDVQWRKVIARLPRSHTAAHPARVDGEQLPLPLISLVLLLIQLTTCRHSPGARSDADRRQVM